MASGGDLGFTDMLYSQNVIINGDNTGDATRMEVMKQNVGSNRTNKVIHLPIDYRADAGAANSNNLADVNLITL